MEGASGKQKPYVMIAPYARLESPNLEQPADLSGFGFDGQLFDRLWMRQTATVGWHLNQIKGPSGSVRGHRDVVKKSLENIKQRGRNTFARLTSFATASSNQRRQAMDEEWADYLSQLVEEERDRCVAYTTSLGIIRRTFEDSRQMRSILDLNLIRYEERDIYLNEEYKNQLRMRCNLIKVPVLFVDGQLVGASRRLEPDSLYVPYSLKLTLPKQGIKELELLNESGKLCLLLAKFKMPKASSSVCLCCGNAKFIACPTCNGSRHSANYHFKFNSIALRCIRCHQNDGLVRCPLCLATTNSSQKAVSADNKIQEEEEGDEDDDDEAEEAATGG